MKRIARYVLAVLALFDGPTATAGTVPVGHEREIILAIGQTTAIEGTGLKVTFAAVVEDSRCPVGAYCIRAGNGQVELKVAGNAAMTSLILNTANDPRAATVDGVKLKLIALNPERREDVEISPSEYSVTLAVEK